MSNRLGGETSPYLLQHADNPVDWYPWGDEALERARREDKPILLSIGYAACHWCHVMAHESFEDAETARLMNEHFINIKVDREERPDLDSIYMQAVQAMTGHGGWPMTMFLRPDGAPFHGGTYYPPQDRHGMPSFRRVLTAIAAAYRDQRGKVDETAAALRQMYSDVAASPAAGSGITAHTFELAWRGLSRNYDEVHGGFGGAPKFPPSMVLDFLLRYWGRTGAPDALRVAHATFVRMSRGGIHDQIGGGFARYSVDARWLVPHFEKMLYDNALLIRFGAHLWQATQDAEVRRVVEETIHWARREMLAAEGGFFSSYDADSEGEEGKFYVWTPEELEAALGADAPLVKAYFGVTREGNFEGKNILFVPDTLESAAARAGADAASAASVIERARRTLYAERARRVWPGRDDKIIAGWNGLMVRGLADAARAFDDSEIAELALRCATFLFERMVVGNTSGNGGLRVFRTFNRGEARIGGFLEDHASLGLAAIAAYELTFDMTWLQRARALADTILDQFWTDAPADAAGKAVRGMFYDTPRDGEQLVTRPRDVTDNAIPSGSSLAAELLLLLGDYFDDAGYRERAADVILPYADGIVHYPSAFGHMLCAADILVHGTHQIAIAGARQSPAFSEMRRVASRQYLPGLLLAGGESGSPLPLLEGKDAPAGGVRAFLCKQYVCSAPAGTPQELEQQMSAILGEVHQRGSAAAG